MAAAQQEEPELPDWAALPRDLLQRCLLPLRSAEDRRAAIRSCKPFARALLANSLRPKGQTACRLRLHVARPQPFAPICSLLVDLGLAEERTHQQADGEQQQQHEGSNGSACRRTQAGLTLVLTSSYTRRSPDRCLNELAACGVRLTRFTRLELEYLLLDVVLPAPGVLAALLPRLQELCLHRCQFTAAAAAALATHANALAHLWHFQVHGLAAGSHDTAAFQLRQLARLPALSSVSLLDDSCPTDFLVALADKASSALPDSTLPSDPSASSAPSGCTAAPDSNAPSDDFSKAGSGGSQGGTRCQAVVALDSLQLDQSHRRCLPGSPLTPSPRWAAALAHVARCTSLRSLTLPCVTLAELDAATATLPLLEHLTLECPAPLLGPDDPTQGGQAHDGGGGGGGGGGWPQQLPGGEGDAMVRRLMGMRCLTRLHWEDCTPYALQGCYSGAHQELAPPCRWRKLSFGRVGVHHLARLPLSQLDAPVAWASLVVDERTSVDDVRRAAGNVAALAAALAARSLGRCALASARSSACGTADKEVEEDKEEEEAPRWLSVWFAPPPTFSATFLGGPGRGDTPAALLRALRPLLLATPAPAYQVSISHLPWGAAEAEALGEALPRACRRLTLEGGSADARACAGLARVAPWLRELCLLNVAVAPSALLCYLRELNPSGGSPRGRGGEGGGALPRELRSLRVVPAAQQAGLEVGGRGVCWDEFRARATEGPEGWEGLQVEVVCVGHGGEGA